MQLSLKWSGSTMRRAALIGLALIALSGCSGISVQPSDVDFNGTDSSHGRGN